MATTGSPQSSKTITRRSLSDDVQDVWICLPGEKIECHRTKSKVRVTLRKHRDIFFDINMLPGALYTVESPADFYCPREKKLLKKVTFADGEKLNIWVGRNFNDTLILKGPKGILGAYSLNELDTRKYPADPKIKPEPLMIVMGKRDISAMICREDDPFYASSTHHFLKPWFDPKFSTLKDFGTDFDYSFSAEKPKIEEYVAVTHALTSEIQPHILAQLEKGPVTGSPTLLFVAPKNGKEPSALDIGIAKAASYIAGSAVITHNLFKESAGYLIENFRNLNKITMTVHIEKKIKGKYKVALKGRPLTKIVSTAAKSVFGMGTAAAKIIHEKKALGDAATKWIDGGYKVSGKGGFGGFKRITLTFLNNAVGGLKIQAIGTVIDVIGDYDDVYVDEKGSNDLSEFLGRVGISVIKAGATAALGSVFAAFISVGLASGVLVASAPVALVALAVIGGYFLAAYIVDAIDERYELKKQAATVLRPY